MTYQSIIKAYRALLAANPGKGLFVNESSIAVLVDEVLGFLCGRMGDVPDMETFLEIEDDLWCPNSECWEGDAGDFTVSEAIHAPVFVNLENGSLSGPVKNLWGTEEMVLRPETARAVKTMIETVKRRAAELKCDFGLYARITHKGEQIVSAYLYKWVGQ